MSPWSGGQASAANCGPIAPIVRELTASGWINLLIFHPRTATKGPQCTVEGVAMAPDTNIWTLIISTLLGGGFLGALISGLFARGKTRAEEKKTEAEAERIKAETTKILSDLNLKQSSPVASKSGDNPEGWIKSGSSPDDYDVSIDQNDRFHSKPSCYIKSRNSPRGFCTLMQMIKADSYIGKRVKLIGNAKSERLEQWAGLWMRVDGSERKTLRFDNMQDRPIKGTTGWTKYQVVLDVPDDSVYIAFGLLVSGPGQVWMAGLSFEIVSSDVPTTDLVTVYREKPINLRFDE
jgi:hypothetical protein